MIDIEIVCIKSHKKAAQHSQPTDTRSIWIRFGNGCVFFSFCFVSKSLPLIDFRSSPYEINDIRWKHGMLWVHLCVKMTAKRFICCILCILRLFNIVRLVACTKGIRIGISHSVRSPFNWWSLWWWWWCGLIDHNTNSSFPSLRNDKTVWQNKQHFTLTHKHSRRYRERITKKCKLLNFMMKREKMSLNGNTNKSVVRLLIILLCVSLSYYVMIYNDESNRIVEYRYRMRFIACSSHFR